MSNDPFNPNEGIDNTQPVVPTEPSANPAPQASSQNEGTNAYQEPGAPYQAPVSQPTPPPSAYPPPYQAPSDPTTPPPSAYPPPYQAPQQTNSYGNANNPYPQQPVYTVPQPKPANGMAIASLVLGILSIVCCCAGFFGILPGVIGLILAIICFSKGNKGGMAVAGLVLNIISVALAVVALIMLIADGSLAQIIYAIESGDLDDLYYYYYRDLMMIFPR